MGDGEPVVHVRVVAGDPERRPWVLLHGTDGTEDDLLPLASSIAPGAPRLAVRGTVRTAYGHAHLVRRPDRTVDPEDLAHRVDPASRAIHRAWLCTGSSHRPLLVGFSNGAIMAAALLAHSPETFAGAVLLRPLTPPAMNVPHPSLAGLPVLVVDATEDRRRAPADGIRQCDVLRRAGAKASRVPVASGHPLGPLDEQVIREWLNSLNDHCAAPDP